MSKAKKKHLRGKGKPPVADEPRPAEVEAEETAAAAETEERREEGAAPAEGVTADGPTPDDATAEGPHPDEASPDATAATAEPTDAEASADGAMPDGDDAQQQFLPLVPLRAVLEAILLVSPEPIEPEVLSKTFPEWKSDEMAKAFEELAAEYGADGRGVRIKLVAGGWRLETRPEFDPWLDRFFEVEHEAKLSLAALETLAVVAYRQPITLPEINEIRGVNSAGVLRTLLERKLVKMHGRKAVVGSPFLYRTTRQFLEHFGLSSLSDLPKPEEMDQLLGEGVQLPGDLGQMAMPVDLPDDDGEGDGEPTAAASTDGSTETPAAAEPDAGSANPGDAVAAPAGDGGKPPEPGSDEEVADASAAIAAEEESPPSETSTDPLPDEPESR